MNMQESYNNAVPIVVAVVVVVVVIIVIVVFLGFEAPEVHCCRVATGSLSQK